jgi:hypothetical protein
MKREAEMKPLFTLAVWEDDHLAAFHSYPTKAQAENARNDFIRDRGKRWKGLTTIAQIVWRSDESLPGP